MIIQSRNGIAHYLSDICELTLNVLGDTAHIVQLGVLSHERQHHVCTVQPDLVLIYSLVPEASAGKARMTHYLFIPQLFKPKTAALLACELPESEQVLAAVYVIEIVVGEVHGGDSAVLGDVCVYKLYGVIK